MANGGGRDGILPGVCFQLQVNNDRPHPTPAPGPTECCAGAVLDLYDAGQQCVILGHSVRGSRKEQEPVEPCGYMKGNVKYGCTWSWS